MDLNTLIKAAKLGTSRKDAQVDCCSVFAAALYDTLETRGIAAIMVSAENKQEKWAHALVQVDDSYYDSMGKFSTAIYRQRAKIHPTVTVEIDYKRDYRIDCYEPEFQEMYNFFNQALTSAFCTGKI
jgi:hypothetical protein